MAKEERIEKKLEKKVEGKKVDAKMEKVGAEGKKFVKPNKKR